MKKLLITFIFILVVVVIISPLVLISLGRLKSPIDVAASKTAKAPLARGFSTTISPNYIPESGTGMTQTDAVKKQSAEVKEAEECFSQSEPQFDVSYNVTKKEGEKTLLKLPESFEWYIEGFALKEIPDIRENVGSDGLGVGLFKLSDICAPKQNEYLRIVNDSGIVLKIFKNADAVLTEKGVMTINTLPCYWYIFETNPHLYLDGSKPNNKYAAALHTVYNGREYRFFFRGSSAVYKTSREFLKQVQTWVSGFQYH